ncbi:MAG TPA: Spy/CpxP family protein refolding chaperone [Terriglobales bacterium]|nr:Spy/CpxP family protein refolding chaperone [Terriglobales bacterium]
MQTIVVIFILLTFVPLLSAQDNHGVDQSQANTAPSAAADETALADVLSAPEALPRGPKDVLDDYEAEMGAITQRFSATLLVIAKAVQNGELTSEQGQKITSEQYETAQMQFELLAAWRAMLEHDLASVPESATNTNPVQQSDPIQEKENEIVMVALPFSSFELNASVAQYLNLSGSQIEGIQQLMTSEHRNLEPLMAKLKATREELMAIDAQHTTEKQMKSLANRQAGLLAKLIVANARMQSKIYKLLTLEQQRKLDDFKRSNESTTIADK